MAQKDALHKDSIAGRRAREARKEAQQWVDFLLVFVQEGGLDCEAEQKWFWTIREPHHFRELYTSIQLKARKRARATNKHNNNK
jgi:hypothetical protein